MNKVSKIAMLISSIILLIVIVVLGSYICFHKSEGGIKDTTGLKGDMRLYDYEAYDNKIVIGYDILNAINSYSVSPEGNRISYVLISKEGSLDGEADDTDDINVYSYGYREYSISSGVNKDSMAITLYDGTVVYLDSTDKDNVKSELQRIVPQRLYQSQVYNNSLIIFTEIADNNAYTDEINIDTNSEIK